MKNMSRITKIIFGAAVALSVAACGGSDEANQKAEINGTLASVPSSEVVLQMLDVNRLVVLDTVKTDAQGGFRYEIDIKKGNPEFLYVYAGGKKAVSLLLEAGDDVNFTVDAQGNVNLDGSEESVKFMQVEKEHNGMVEMFAQMSAQYESAAADQQDALAKQMTDEYIKYYKNSLRYVLANTGSMTSIPVLYRNLGELPVFSQTTDAIIFNQVADSLSVKYPESKYVKSLRNMADARMENLKLEARVNEAETVGYFDIELPGLDGKMKKLSEAESKVTLLLFWSAAQGAQNKFNSDVLKPLYEKYHAKGFEIYQVSLDVDKVMWATTVMGQDLPWVSVCDTRGAASPYVAAYNLQALPVPFLISNGEIQNVSLKDKNELEKAVAALMK